MPDTPRRTLADLKRILSEAIMRRNEAYHRWREADRQVKQLTRQVRAREAALAQEGKGER